MFFNASVQGNYQVVRNMLASKKLVAGVVGTIAFSALLDMTARAISDDRDKDGRTDWDSIPEWEKEKNIHLPFAVDGVYAKIPAPWVYNVFWRLGQMISESFAGVRKWQDTGLDTIGMTLSTFNPLGTTPMQSVPQMISPTAADPFVQIIENKNFLGNPLGPEHFRGAGEKPASELSWSTMPEGYKWLAREVNKLTGGNVAESGVIDWRPSTYKLLVDTAMGSGGRFLAQAFNAPGAWAKEELKLKDVPLLRQFASDATADPMEAQLYHERIARVLGAERAQKQYVSGPNRDLNALQELRRDRAGDLRMVGYAKEVEKQLTNLRQKLRLAESRGQEPVAKQLKDRIELTRQRFNETYARRVGH